MMAANVSEESLGGTSSPAVEVRDLTVVYGTKRAVRDISFAVPQSSTLAVIGPSGSGKSTLLRAIAGLEPVAAGTVLIHGEDRTSTPTHERRVGLMFQDDALFPHLDVAANVAFGMKMQKRPPEVVDRRTAEVLDLVGMADFGNRSIETLSGGEAQRVALARALAPSPNVLLLDEPLGSLDRVLREELVTELRRLFSTLGLAVIHVTHDQQEAFSLADEVAVMTDGSVDQMGSPSEIWRRPSSASVATFLGHPNMWLTTAGTVVAPIPSLSISDGDGSECGDQALEVVVDASEFREGRHRLTVVERAAGANEPRTFVVDCDHEPGLGAVMHLCIDESALVLLSADG